MTDQNKYEATLEKAAELLQSAFHVTLPDIALTVSEVN